MARTLTSYDFAKPGRRRFGYDWNQWFDGRIWELTKDKDFKIKPQSFKTTATREAKARGLRLDADALETKVVLQAHKEEVAEAPAE